ncbi:MAG: hypothetical protein KAG37_02765, partial [Flavobacteriales bacterium]|nr:hypothetical protein [Flavobacteriales bacterium]
MKVFNKLSVFVGAIAISVLSLISCNNAVTVNTDAQAKEVSNKVKVAVFNGNGAGSTSVIETIEALKIDTGIIPSEISAAEIQLGKLDEFDVIIFPGGSATKELNNL